MTPDQPLRHLRRANAVARRAMDMHRHPFGAGGHLFGMTGTALAGLFEVY